MPGNRYYSVSVRVMVAFVADAVRVRETYFMSIETTVGNFPASQYKIKSDIRAEGLFKSTRYSAVLT